MSNKYLILLISCLFSFLLIKCNEQYTIKRNNSYQFKITNALTGEISSQEGTVSVECKEDRVVLFFKEAIEDKTSSTDDLIGEIILGFQLGDTVGVYQLNEISGKREKGKVGILAFLDKLDFDDLAAQYISNSIRYETVENGSVEILDWSIKEGEVLKGKLNATLKNEAKKVEIEGEFTIKWNKEEINCN